MADRLFYVYRITNLLDGKIYIGGHCTSNIDDGYMGSGTRLIKAIQKYGKLNFKKEILEWFDNEATMWSRERELVNEEFLARDDVYNLVLGGNDGWTKSNTTIKRLKETDEEYSKRIKQKISLGVKRAISEGKGNVSLEHMVMMNKKSNSPSSKEKRKQTYKKIKYNQGPNHSLYGKRAIHNNAEWIWVDSTKYLYMLEQGWKPGKGKLPKRKLNGN